MSGTWGGKSVLFLSVQECPHRERERERFHCIYTQYNTSTSDFIS